MQRLREQRLRGFHLNDTPAHFQKLVRPELHVTMRNFQRLFGRVRSCDEALAELQPAVA